MTTIRINKKFSKFDFAKKYYSILFTLNNIHLSIGELNLFCYCAVNGTLSTPPVRNGFIEEFGIPKNSVYNMMSRLQKRKLLVKIQGKIRINPAFYIDFNKDDKYSLQIGIEINKDE